MVFRVPIWGGENPEISEDPRREHADAPPKPEMEPGEAGGKGGFASRLHRQVGARRGERLPGCPYEDFVGFENPVERSDARRVAHIGRCRSLRYNGFNGELVRRALVRSHSIYRHHRRLGLYRVDRPPGHAVAADFQPHRRERAVQ
jgi:hypothetical protein